MVVETREEKNKGLEESLRKEELKEKRIKTGKKIAKIIFIIIGLITLFILYMHYFGAYGLEVREYKIESSKLPSEFHGFKIVQFSDLHYLTTMKNKEVKNLINKINELKPDIIVFTGDLITTENKEIKKNDIDNLTKNLKNLKASIGIYAVKGNEDYNKYYDQVISKTDIKIINNSYELIFYKGATPILLTGVGSILNDDCDIASAFSYDKADNIYTISLVHEPDVADNILINNKADLILAGHSHNGQIKLPILGNVLKEKEAKKYPNSKYIINNTELYVSGGLGTSKYEFRLFNHPSINFFRLVKGTN